MALNIKQKLLLLLLSSVSSSVILVGVALSYLGEQLYKRDAVGRFSDARGVLVWRLKEMEIAARAQAQAFADRPDVVSRIGEITEYSSDRSMARTSERGKKSLAQELGREFQTAFRGTDRRQASILDKNGRLLSFWLSDDHAPRIGFITRESTESMPHVLEPARGEWVRAPGEALICSAALHTGNGSRFVECDGSLVFHGIAPVKRPNRDGSKATIGWVVISETIAQSVADAIRRETGARIALFLHDKPFAGTLTGIPLDADLRRKAALLSADGSAGFGWVERKGYFLQSFRIPLGENEVYLLLGTEKAPVLAQIKWTRTIVMLVLALSTLMIVPAGIFVSRRSITRPVTRLVDEVRAIEQGRYDSISAKGGDDELGELARCINNMASTIRSREAELLQSRATLTEAQRLAQLGNWEWDSATGRWSYSEEIYEIIGCKGFETMLPFVHPEDRGRMEGLLTTAQLQGIPYSTDYRIERPDGSAHTVHEQVEVKRSESGTIHLLGTTQLVTELKRVECELRKVNRAMKTLSSCNEVLVRAVSEQELLYDITRILVDVGQYRLAWVGLVERDDPCSIRPVACAGAECDYLNDVLITWADTPERQEPTGMAVRTGKPQIMNDIPHDERFLPWRDHATRRGYKSSIAFPLFDENSAVLGTLNLYSSDPIAFDEQEIALLRELAGDVAYGITILRVRDEHQRMEKEREHGIIVMQRSMQSTIQALAATIEMRDPYTAGHQRRVSELATAIAVEMGLTEDVIRGVRLGGIVHDIGKMMIPSEILSKPGRLSIVEYGFIKTHPQTGYEILKDVEFPWPLAMMVLQHHERLDGSGYPMGLKDGEILLEAKILAVADVVESMASHRPYRPSLGIDSALEEIGKNRGRLYDPIVVDALVALVQEKGFFLD